MNSMKRFCRFFLFVAAGAFGAASAQTGSGNWISAAASSPEQVVASLEQRTDTGVKYVCGGIGAAEVSSLRKAAADYDLMMTFAASTGAFIADVDIEIADARGRSVLRTNCAAPIMLVDLPQRGNYLVRAEAGGKVLRRNAQVRGRGDVQRIRMAWPVQTVDMGLRPSSAPDSTDSGATASGASGDASSRGNAGPGSK